MKASKTHRKVSLMRPSSGHEALGAIMSLMLKVDERWRYPIGNLRVWLEPALSLSQFAIFLNRANEVVGYLSWAFFSERTSFLMQSDSSFLPHISDWTDGEKLWLIDLVALDGHFSEILHFSEKNLFTGNDYVYWLSRKRQDASNRARYRLKPSEGGERVSC